MRAHAVDGATPTPPTAAVLPARVQSEVGRILDRAARRLLDEQINSDALGTASTGRDACSLDGSRDQPNGPLASLGQYEIGRA
jgi:hypothetical protein